MGFAALRARERQTVVWSVVWLSVIVLFISQNVVWDVSFGRPVRWWHDALFEALYWVPFVAATPVFVYMASRTRTVVAHVMVAVAFALLQPLVSAFLTNIAAQLLFAPGDDRIAGIAEGARHAYPALVLTALWKYAVIVAVCLAVRYYRSTKDAERQVAEAQLAALKMQIHPHFLFNALHSAAMLTSVDPKRAHEVIVQLADLLRATLDSSALLEVSLRAELEFLDRYLAIERIRFEDRLAVRFDVGGGTEQLLVPSLILQPLVENALRHGLAPKQGPGQLGIRSRLVTDALEIEVWDDGVGMPAGNGRPPGFGVGLANVQERVNAANQRRTPIALIRNAVGGTSVTIRLPIRMAT